MSPRSPAAEREVPPGFQLRRDAALGRHPLLEVFPGLDRLATARRQEPDAQARSKLFHETFVEIDPGDLWMYVAPWKKLRTIRRRRFEPVIAPQVDCIVIGEGHLRESPELTLFLDIYHELCHIQQRHRGEELFDRPEAYVRRPTELQAYKFVIEEARRLRVADAVLREYLRVEWIDDSDFGELLDAMGVARA
ncbi:MAG TPA: hypothetical protein VGV89_04675 [Thermoplasmata archaeon]|nr:hypothetical protein [Thermoplasmata archaeon]